MDLERRWNALAERIMQRLLGIALGFGTHLLFFTTVWYLFWFLKGGEPPEGANNDGLGVDLALALLFVVPHSPLLHRKVRARLERLISPSFYGCFFTIVTCTTLLATIWLWRPSPVVVWQFGPTGRQIITVAFIGCWVGLFYSLSLTGLGYQTGWTPFWYWVRREPAPRREFRPRGAYMILRHPVYLSVLGLCWFTPVMTLDRVVLTAVWSTYIFIGSYLKDVRLVYYLGERYRDYQARVPGYPGIFWGPLARVRPAPPEGSRSLVTAGTPADAGGARSGT
jgi:methanethiol S-methyltransferase